MENIDNNKKSQNKEEKIMAEKWKEVFGQRIGELTGHVVGVDDIHSDLCGWYYYIPAKSLEQNHPLLMVHYRGPIFAAIPYQEYDRLESGELDPVEYVEQAFWSVGYFWGGGSMVGGAYWQPVDIFNKEIVDRYLTILKCRTLLNSSGYAPTEERCANCKLSTCYFSKFKESDVELDNDKIFAETDRRVEFFRAMAKRVERETGMKLRGMCLHNSVANKVVLVPNMCAPDTLQLNIPASLNNQLLYYPDYREWEQLVDDFQVELTTGIGMEEASVIIEGNTDEARKEVAWRFLESAGILKKWFDWSKAVADVKVGEGTASVQGMDKTNFFIRFFRKMAGK